MCKKKTFGIDLDDVIKYLEIKKINKFIEGFKNKYTENIDYIVIKNKIKAVKCAKLVHYKISLDTFEKICMRTNSKVGNEVRDYFINLRKFIYYYKNNISNMILKSKGVVYLFTVNKNKRIFKFGQTRDLRDRLFKYMTGREKHPDVDFIMQVDNPRSIENCVKSLIKNNVYKQNKELYRINLDATKEAIFNCAITDSRMKEINVGNVDTYILFDSSTIDDENAQVTKIKKQNKKSIKSSKSHKKLSKKTSKISKKTSKKAS